MTLLGSDWGRGARRGVGGGRGEAGGGGGGGGEARLSLEMPFRQLDICDFRVP